MSAADYVLTLFAIVTALAVGHSVSSAYVMVSNLDLALVRNRTVHAILVPLITVLTIATTITTVL